MLIFVFFLDILDFPKLLMLFVEEARTHLCNACS
jgi:hypothetical protein